LLRWIPFDHLRQYKRDPAPAIRSFRQLQILESDRNAELAENLTFQALRAR
jgi:hypothetical protein